MSIDNNGVVLGVGTSFSDNFIVGDVLGVYEGPDTFVPTGCFRYYEILTISGATGMTVTGKTIVSFNDTAYSRGELFDNYRSFHQTNIETNTGFSEFLTFQATNVFNVKIGNYANFYDWQENPFLLANNVFFSGSYQNITIGDRSYDNTFDDDMNSLYFGDNCSRNIITNDFEENTIGSYFRNNIIICDMQDNQIGNFFQYNMLGDNDGEDFDQNRIGNYFESNFLTFANASFFNNNIGDNFSENLINYGFSDNYITGDFYDNRINGDFSDNIIGQLFYLNLINSDFSDNQIGRSCYENDFWGNVYKNKVGRDFYLNTIGSSNNSTEFYENNIQHVFKANDIGGDFYGNTIGTQFASNVTSSSFYDNVIGNDCFPNTFDGQAYNNIIGNNFQFNDFQGSFAFNQIGNNFNDNGILDGFGFGGSQAQGNRIGNNFSSNNIGEYFYNNSIPDNFENNDIGNYFQWNVINTNIGSIDFTVNYGNITGFSYTQAGDSAVDGLYTEMEGDTNGEGVDAVFNIGVSGGIVISVSPFTPITGYRYQIGDTITISGTDIGGVTGVIDGFSSDAVGKSGTTGSYLNVIASGGAGENATFDIDVAGDVVTDIYLNNGGSAYSVNNTLTILGSLFGGVDGVDDITITVDSIYSDDVVITVTEISDDSLFYQPYTKQIFERKGGSKRVSYYDEDDVLNINSVYESSGYIPVYSQSLSFPFAGVSFEFRSDGVYTNNGGETNQTVNNVQELVTLFNAFFSLRGYFFDNTDGKIGLYIYPSLKEQFSPNGTYSIYIYTN